MAATTRKYSYRIHNMGFRGTAYVQTYLHQPPLPDVHELNWRLAQGDEQSNVWEITEDSFEHRMFKFFIRNDSSHDIYCKCGALTFPQGLSTNFQLQFNNNWVWNVQCSFGGTDNYNLFLVLYEQGPPPPCAVPRTLAPASCTVYDTEDYTLTLCKK